MSSKRRELIRRHRERLRSTACAAPMLAMSCSLSRPRVSESIGVLPNQVAAERAKLQEWKDKGELTGVNILDNGAVEYTCNGDQGARGWQRYRGNKVNLDGAYSDTYTPDDRFGAEPETGNDGGYGDG